MEKSQECTHFLGLHHRKGKKKQIIRGQNDSTMPLHMTVNLSPAEELSSELGEEPQDVTYKALKCKGRSDFRNPRDNWLALWRWASCLLLELGNLLFFNWWIISRRLQVWFYPPQQNMAERKLQETNSTDSSQHNQASKNFWSGPTVSIGKNYSKFQQNSLVTEQLGDYMSQNKVRNCRDLLNLRKGHFVVLCIFPVLENKQTKTLGPKRLILCFVPFM